ncbi:MAG TPA: hypothetical protein VGS19_15985 [Streptosporangiaceae bacterium]|nr:hypothetical protein [Streptosporangiaceae bacterium]
MLAAGGGGLAWASIPDGNGVFNARVDNTSGAVRIIDTTTQTCGTSETPIAWNQQGPAGPQGPSGPAGVGAPGPAGPPGAGSIAATGNAAGPIPEPAADYHTGPTKVLTAPFTLTTAGFVHALAYGQLNLQPTSTCGGSQILLPGAHLDLTIDGTSVPGPTSLGDLATVYPSRDAGTLSSANTIGTDVWLNAGAHTLTIDYYPYFCTETHGTHGTATISNLHLEAVTY